MIIDKLLIIVLSLFLVLCAGSCNIYPIYVQKVMDRFNFSIREINLFGTCINVGVWFGFPMGSIYDRFGPKFSCLVGLLFLGGGYLSLHFLMNSEIFIKISIYPILLLGFIMGQGSAILYLTSVTTNLNNFRFKDSSSIVALLVSSFAISASIFTTLKENLQMLTQQNFFYILAIFLSIIIFICMILFKKFDNVYSDDKLMRNYEKFKEKKIIRFLIFFNFINLNIYIFGVLYNHYMDRYIFPLILIYPSMQLLNFFLIILEKCKVFDKIYFYKFKRLVLNKSNKSLSFELFELDLSLNLSKNNVVSDIKYNLNATNKEISFYAAIKSTNLILLFIMLILGLGSVISNLNNIHFVIKSIKGGKDRHISDNNIVIYHDKDLFLYVIFYFIFNSTTRLSSGLILDHLIKKNKFYFYLLFFSFVGFISQFLGIFMDKNLLFISISLAGATHGGIMTFTPVFARNEFGLKNMGKILGFLTTGCAIGSIIISDFIFISPYYYFVGSSEKNHHTYGKCNGSICFYPSYMITSFFFLINILISYFLLRRNDIRYNESKLNNNVTDRKELAN